MNILEAFDDVKSRFHMNFELKKHQEEIISLILNDKNVFAVLPTGYGKSLCYILPPLLLDVVYWV